MSVESTIMGKWSITDEEYAELDEKFGQLCEYAGWQLIRKNNKNNHTNEQEDVAQKLRIDLIKAACYYKRQVYIESCLFLCVNHAKDRFTLKIIDTLLNLWLNKTHHGANRQKFGPHQEKLLGWLTKRLVPNNKRPSKKAPLQIDDKFTTYCKAIIWNGQKAMGKKITREKAIRAGMASLSEYEYLASI